MSIKIIKNAKFTSDFGEVAYDLYEPECVREPLTIIQIAHGMLEHKGRYEWVAKEFAKNGYVVAVSDHRGHGESLNIQNDIVLGEMGMEGFERANYDLYKLNCILKERFIGAKVVLLGHSMGSLLAQRYLFLYAESIEALILSGSPTYRSLVGIGIALGEFFKFFNMQKTGTKALHSLSFGEFERRFASYWSTKRGANPNKESQQASASWLCSDLEAMQAYKDDPKCNARFSLQSFLGLFRGLKEVYNTHLEGVKSPSLPILFVSGYDDVCGDFGKGVQKAQKHLQMRGFKKVDIILYKDARHEVFNEPIKRQVVADVLLWVQENIN